MIAYIDQNLGLAVLVAFAGFSPASCSCFSTCS